LTTDSAGKIYLGSLAYAADLWTELKATGSELTRSWEIKAHKQLLNYPSTLFCRLGEQTKLHVDPEWTVKDVIFFTMMKEQAVV
jgi:hypothetical protein